MIFIKGILYDNCYYYLNSSNVQAKSTFFIKLIIWVISFDSWRYKNQCNTHTCTHSYIHTHVCTHIYIQSYIFQSFLVPTDYTYICRFAWEHHMEQLLGDVKKKWPGLCFYSCMARELSLEKMVRIRVYLGMKIRKVERIFLFPTQML